MSYTDKFQMSLFSSNTEPSLCSETIKLPNLDIVFFKYFFSFHEGKEIFEDLLNSTSWRQDVIKMYNKQINLPRLTAWFGDPGKKYLYSGICMVPTPWTSRLLDIKTRVEEVSDYKFNSVLLNFYRDGNDSVGWHQDNEPELGKNPTIASASFGETRQFQLKHIHDKTQTLSINLFSESLLVMKGETQHFWKHQIPKTQRSVGPRINLTFRYIY